MPRAKDFLRTGTCEIFDILMKEYGSKCWHREDEVAREAVGIAIACWEHFSAHPEGTSWTDTLLNTLLQHVGRALRGNQQLSAAPSAPMILAQERTAAPKPTADPSAEISLPPSFGEQLRKLLNDARMRPEDIAEEIGIDARNVYRHLSNETRPTLVNIGLYEHALSKRLKETVKLPASVKRQNVSITSVKRQ